MIDKETRDAISNQLRQVALQDGVLSQDEQDLISTTIVDLERYNELLQVALEDGVIDNREEKQLFEGRMHIMESAYAKAREDYKITDNEREILKEICRIIRDISENI